MTGGVVLCLVIENALAILPGPCSATRTMDGVARLKLTEMHKRQLRMTRATAWVFPSPHTCLTHLSPSLPSQTLLPWADDGWTAHPHQYCHSYGYRGNQDVANTYAEARTICEVRSEVAVAGTR
jgi:hypothetical protein